MPKRAPASTRNTGAKKRKSAGPSATTTTAEPTEINYDLLTAAILRQSQNPGNSPTNVEQELSPLEVANQPATSNSTSLSPSAEAQPADTSVINLVNALFNQDAGEPATAHVKNVISLSDGIPLGAATSYRLKAKIWANQFIDLSLLLQRREEPISLNISSGSVTLQQGNSKPKASLSMQQWTDAFLISMGIYIERFPDQAPHLLKYCFDIREMNKMLGDKAWRIYDENFRMLKESADLPWQKPVEELRIND